MTDWSEVGWLAGLSRMQRCETGCVTSYHMAGGARGNVSILDAPPPSLARGTLAGQDPVPPIVRRGASIQVPPAGGLVQSELQLHFKSVIFLQGSEEHF